jgi:predicted metal-dependent hydrolase
VVCGFGRVPSHEWQPQTKHLAAKQAEKAPGSLIGLCTFCGEVALVKMPNFPIAPRTVALEAIGKSYAVHYLNRRGTGLELTQAAPSVLELNGNVSNQKGCVTLLRQWLQVQGRLHLVPWTEKMSLEAGLAFKGVQVRGQKTRWGSCSSKGTISLNYKLLFLSPHLVSYIIIHELCHTVHLNHSRNYWSFLSSFEPKCTALDKEMKGVGRLVPRWVSWGQ